MHDKHPYQGENPEANIETITALAQAGLTGYKPRGNEGFVPINTVPSEYQYKGLDEITDID